MGIVLMTGKDLVPEGAVITVITAAASAIIRAAISATVAIIGMEGQKGTLEMTGAAAQGQQEDSGHSANHCCVFWQARAGLFKPLNLNKKFMPVTDSDTHYKI